MVNKELVISDEKELAKAPDRIKVPLTSEDLLYRTIRDNNVASVGSVLHQRATLIDQQYKVSSHSLVIRSLAKLNRRAS